MADTNGKPVDRRGTTTTRSEPSRTLPPTSRPRALAPEFAKFKSQAKPSLLPSSSSSSATTTSASQSSASSSFLARFRARYRALPSPVRRTFRILRVIAPVVPIGIFFSEHIFQVMWVRGPSMSPYLNEDYAEMQTKSDMVLVNMWPWGSGWPWQSRRRLERGMVVTFRSPANPSHIAIKRVIALPGDRVSTREPCPRPSQIVPFNHVWLEGDADDPRKSLDSNTYGPVSISLITGRVIAVVWPRMRLLKWWDWDHAAGDGEQTGVHASTEHGRGFKNSVSDRVLKEAVKVESPSLD